MSNDKSVIEEKDLEITLTRKFEITELSKVYEPEEKEHSEFNTISYLDSSFSGNENIRHTLYIGKQSREQIFSHIGWGENFPKNQVEQGGIMLGHSFIDKKKNLIYGVVKHAITGESARGSAAYLALNHQTWKEIIDQVDELLDTNPEENYQVIGWYHTHPNSLSVFMSGTDKATQSHIFNKIWQFAIVLNPQKKIWRAFFGENSIECQGFMMLHK